MSRPATMRASSSGNAWRWTIDNERKVARSSSRSRHTRPVADCSTPRKTRRVGLASMNDDRSSRQRVLPRLELVELAVLAPDPAHRAGGRAHDHGLGLDHAAPETHASQHRAGGDAGRREYAVALHHVLHG